MLFFYFMRVEVRVEKGKKKENELGDYSGVDCFGICFS